MYKHFLEKCNGRRHSETQTYVWVSEWRVDWIRVAQNRAEFSAVVNTKQ